MSRLAQGRKTPFVDPGRGATRMETSTRDTAKSLGLNQSEILRTALEQAVEVAMRERNYQHPEEIPQAEQRSWLGFFRWW